MACCRIPYLKDFVPWILPLVQLLLAQVVLYLGRKLLKVLGILGPNQKDDAEKQMEIMGQHKAEAFNIGEGSEK